MHHVTRAQKLHSLHSTLICVYVGEREIAKHALFSGPKDEKERQPP